MCDVDGVAVVSFTAYDDVYLMKGCEVLDVYSSFTCWAASTKEIAIVLSRMYCCSMCVDRSTELRK